MDLFVTNRTYYALGKRVSEPGRNFLFINRGNDNGWIKVALEGRRSNRNGYGALVRVVAGDLVQTAESTSAHGYNSTNDPILHFGLGKRTAVDSIEVRWPSGAVQTVERPKIRQTVRIIEPRT
jgi:hypothetical protein